jgi:hypothetical protein
MNERISTFDLDERIMDVDTHGETGGGEVLERADSLERERLKGAAPKPILINLSRSHRPPVPVFPFLSPLGHPSTNPRTPTAVYYPYSHSTTHVLHATTARYMESPCERVYGRVGQQVFSPALVPRIDNTSFSPSHPIERPRSNLSTSRFVPRKNRTIHPSPTHSISHGGGQ